MDFDAIVENIVESSSGAFAAVIMANDGVPLAEFRKPDSTMDALTIGIEYTTVISEIKKASEVLEAGRLEEMTIRSDSIVFVVRLINDEYFIALVLSPDGNSGKGRYLARIAAPKLAEEL